MKFCARLFLFQGVVARRSSPGCKLQLTAAADFVSLLFCCFQLFVIVHCHGQIHLQSLLFSQQPTHLVRYSFDFKPLLSTVTLSTCLLLNSGSCILILFCPTLFFKSCQDECFSFIAHFIFCSLHSLIVRFLFLWWIVFTTVLLCKNDSHCRRQRKGERERRGGAKYYFVKNSVFVSDGGVISNHACWDIPHSNATNRSLILVNCHLVQKSSVCFLPFSAQ